MRQRHLCQLFIILEDLQGKNWTPIAEQKTKAVWSWSPLQAPRDLVKASGRNPHFPCIMCLPVIIWMLDLKNAVHLKDQISGPCVSKHCHAREYERAMTCEERMEGWAQDGTPSAVWALTISAPFCKRTLMSSSQWLCCIVDRILSLKFDSLYYAT